MSYKNGKSIDASTLCITREITQQLCCFKRRLEFVYCPNWLYRLVWNIP